MTKHKFNPTQILVPTDFSSSALIAVSAASALAKDLGAAVYLLNVIPMLPIVGESGYFAYFSEEKYLEYSRHLADEKLLVLLKDLRTEGIKAECGVEIGNDVVGNILMVLARERSDMIVISTHGISGWRPFVFGSIAEKVIKLADCPLLLLRTPKSPV